MGLISDILSKVRVSRVGTMAAGGKKIQVVPGTPDASVVSAGHKPDASNIPQSWINGWMVPGRPMQTIDRTQGMRHEDEENEPREFQAIPGSNSTIVPRIPYGLLPFSTLRYYAESVPEVASCIRILTQECIAFKPTLLDKNGQTLPPDHPYQWMIETPDRRTPWPVWLSKFLYNVLVYDAGSIFLEMDEDERINGARIIDGSTIFPILDPNSRTPQPPEPAYSQIIWGSPYTWMTARQLWYKPRHLRADAPYGRTSIEDSLWAIQLLENLWDYESQKYMVGNIPESIATVPSGAFKSVAEILEFEQTFNDRMSGNTKERVRMRFLPEGAEIKQTKEMVFNQDTYQIASKAIRLSYGVLPSEVGETPGAGLGGSGYMEAMQSSFYRMAIGPLLAYIESPFNDILRMNGESDVVFKMAFPTESIDPSKEEEKYRERFINGIITLDECRTGLRMPKIGGEEGKFMNNPPAAGQQGQGAPGLPGQGGNQPQLPGGFNLDQDPGDDNQIDVLDNPIDVYNMRRPVDIAKMEGEEQTKQAIRIAQTLGYDGDLHEFIIGFAEELEHADTVNNNPITMGMIAADHLEEDPQYYTKLKAAMEKMHLQKDCGLDPADDTFFAAEIRAVQPVDFPTRGDSHTMIIAIGNDDNDTRPALWKPQHDEKPEIVGKIGGALYCRPEAVYLMDRELAPSPDDYLVPVSYTAEIDGNRGSIQLYVKNRKPKIEAENFRFEYIMQAAILDYITGQTDRVGKNFMQHPFKQGRPVLIDNDQSFPANDVPPASDFITAAAGKEIPHNMMDMIFLVMGHHELWEDLRDVLDSDAAVMNARHRAEELYKSGKIPGSTGPEMIRVVYSENEA